MPLMNSFERLQMIDSLSDQLIELLGEYGDGIRLVGMDDEHRPQLKDTTIRLFNLRVKAKRLMNMVDARIPDCKLRRRNLRLAHPQWNPSPFTQAANEAQDSKHGAPEPAD